MGNGLVEVFIENEAGSAIKNIFDEATLKHLGAREVSAPYPFPYGFVIGTRSGDGDALDCHVVTDLPLRSGETVACRVVGLIEQVEDGAIDHKLIAVPEGGAAVDVKEAAARIADFARRVFAHVPGKRMEIGRLLGAAEAMAHLARCRL